jgi:hypothetical protein
MKRSLFYAVLLLSFCFSSCKKDNSAKPSPGNYLPLTNGSTWKYNYVSDGGTEDSLIVTMTGENTKINGQTYYGATSTFRKNSSFGYFYAGNHIYATRTAGGLNPAIELQLLNDTASVGYRWTTQPTVSGKIGENFVRAVNIIKEKNISRTIEGKTYTDVIHTQILLQYDFGDGNGYQTSVTYDFYLAKDVGLIENDANTLDLLFETETLFDYTIK